MLHNPKWDALLRDTPFLPAQDLGLIPKERAALIRVLALLETRPETLNFNIGTYYHTDDGQCGAPACLAGWADYLGALGWFTQKRTGGSCTKRFGTVTKRPGVHELFYPRSVGYWANIPLAAVARALRAYLTTGRPDWSAAA
jgi:hypothetical protein